MNKYDFVALEYRLKHARARQKRAVIDSYPALRGRTIKSVQGLIRANTLTMTGKLPKKRRPFWIFKKRS